MDSSFRRPVRVLLLILLAATLLARSNAPARADPEAPPLTPVLERYRVLSRFDVDVEELGGLAPLPSDDASRVRFLAVSDEGQCAVDAPIVRGSLFALTFRIDGEGGIEHADSTPIELHLGDHVDRLDPAWAAMGGWHPDLESCVPLPGTSDLYLLGGERSPEDITDGGANRLYVVRYPAGGAERAEVVDYLRLPDLQDDGINDRLEAVVAVAREAPDAWNVFAFKERTAVVDGIPTYFPLVLRRGEAGFELSLAPGMSLRTLPTLIGTRERLGSQTDAYIGPAGRIWVLDRWRRELHIAKVVAGPVLQHVESLDAHDVVRAVAEEAVADEPAAPGSDHIGYGRHEALAFDAAGRLWLIADLGNGQPSPVTVLTPHGER